MTKLPSITKTQENIIQLIYRFRFLNRIQIQKLLKIKSVSKLNYYLKDLTEKEYLKRSHEDTFPNKLRPAVYHIGPNGIRFLRSQDNCEAEAIKNLYREDNRSSSFRDCCLLLADIYLGFENRQDKDVQSIMQMRSDYPAHPLKDILSDLKPSAYVAQKKSGKTKRSFLEILYDLPDQYLRQRIKQYLKFYRGSVWESETKTDFPTIMIVCPNDRVLAYVRHYVKTKLAQFDGSDLIIDLTTSDKVKEFGLTSDIWKKI